MALHRATSLGLFVWYKVQHKHTQQKKGQEHLFSNFTSLCSSKNFSFDQTFYIVSSSRLIEIALWEKKVKKNRFTVAVNQYWISACFQKFHNVKENGFKKKLDKVVIGLRVHLQYKPRFYPANRFLSLFLLLSCFLFFKRKRKISLLFFSFFFSKFEFSFYLLSLSLSIFYLSFVYLSLAFFFLMKAFF